MARFRDYLRTYVCVYMYACLSMNIIHICCICVCMCVNVSNLYLMLHVKRSDCGFETLKLCVCKVTAHRTEC